MKRQFNHVKPPKGGFIYEPEVVFPGDIEPHDDYRDAWADMVDAKFCRSRKYEEQQWRALRIGAHPETVEFSRVAVATLRRYNVPMFAAEMVRTREKQAQYYAEGFSNAKPGQGPHEYGMAVDLVHGIRGWSLTKKQWEFIGHIIKDLCSQRGFAMTWGGDWPPIKEKVGWDPAHWQRKAWKQDMSHYPFMPINKRNEL